MKTYRIQVRYAQLYFNFTTKANSIDDAGMDFVKAVKEGTIKVEKEPLYTPEKTFITYEEVADVTTQQTVRQEA